MKGMETILAIYHLNGGNWLNQIRCMGCDLKDAEVMSKVMRSLLLRLVHVVTSSEEARDISKLSLDELSGSLRT